MKVWLKNAILYQIYPTSFYDGNGDGIGDLSGITQKLDYVKELGANLIWINPFYKSPFLDGGYDVADYYSVDEKFGTLDDFDKLIEKANGLGIKVCLDLVIGHTSWEHEWFKMSGEKERNSFSDYYIWTSSCFNAYKNKTLSGLHDRDGCFYINYYAHQPALNFGFDKIDAPEDDPLAYDTRTDWQMHYKDERLSPLREEIYSIIRFWMNRGVCGFRVDMAASLIKNTEDITAIKWLWGEMFSKIKAEFPDIIFISEWGDPKVAVGEIGFDIDYTYHETEVWNSLFRCESGTNLAPRFMNGKNYFSEEGKGSVEGFLADALKTLDCIDGKGYFSVVSGSHDEVRLAEGKSKDQLKVIFAFLLTFKHVPFIYYGDEIGLNHNFDVSRDGGYIRTGARTPMQWSEAQNRGFSTARELYLPVNDIPLASVEAEQENGASLLNAVKMLIKARRDNPALNADASFKVISSENGGYPLVYERACEEQKIAVIISPSADEKLVNISYKKVILHNNCTFGDRCVISNGVGFAIVEI